MNLSNRVAVITGAGSGIGRALAMSLARRRCHLALVDREAGALQAVAQQAMALGVRASCHSLDVTDRAGVAALPGEVLAAHGGIQLLINNAGVALGGSFDQVSEADFDWVMDVNFHAVVRMTRAFLPALREADVARIVNVSSLYGLISPPQQAAYSASKFAVRGFSNALRHELVGSSVGVSVVHPGGVATAIASNARIGEGVDKASVPAHLKQMQSMLRLPAEQAGEIIASGIERAQARILVGTDAKIVSVIERLLPVGYWRVVSALMRT